jgi:hypothetical protein
MIKLARAKSQVRSMSKARLVASMASESDAGDLGVGTTDIDVDGDDLDDDSDTDTSKCQPRSDSDDDSDSEESIDPEVPASKRQRHRGVDSQSIVVDLDRDEEECDVEAEEIRQLGPPSRCSKEQAKSCGVPVNTFRRLVRAKMPIIFFNILVFINREAGPIPRTRWMTEYG